MLLYSFVYCNDSVKNIFEMKDFSKTQMMWLRDNHLQFSYKKDKSGMSHNINSKICVDSNLLEWPHTFPVSHCKESPDNSMNDSDWFYIAWSLIICVAHSSIWHTAGCLERTEECWRGTPALGITLSPFMLHSLSVRVSSQTRSFTTFPRGPDSSTSTVGWLPEIGDTYRGELQELGRQLTVEKK